jgi:hypothetical protein
MNIHNRGWEGTTEVNMQMIKRPMDNRLLELRQGRQYKLTLLTSITLVHIPGNISLNAAPVVKLMHVCKHLFYSSMTKSIMNTCNDIPPIRNRGASEPPVSSSPNTLTDQQPPVNGRKWLDSTKRRAMGS